MIIHCSANVVCVPREKSDIFKLRMKLNRTQILGSLILGAIVIAVLLLRWKLMR